MGIDPGPQIVIAFIALFLSAFFTLLKYSFEDLNKIKLEKMREEEIISEAMEIELNKIVDNSDKISLTLMILDYTSNTFVAANLAFLGFKLYGTLGSLIALILTSMLIIIVGEIAPYYISVSKGDEMAIKFQKFTKIITKILSPLTFIVSNISMLLGSIFGDREDFDEPKITEDELFAAVNLSRDEGILDFDEYGMIEKVFDFSDTYVKDVMTPRTDVIAVDVEDEVSEILKVFREEGYSRIPVYEENIDNVIGILHIKDLLPIFLEEKELNIREILRKPIYTFEYQKSSDLFNQMRVKSGTFAVVLDEYGGTDGIVTMEDLIEEIVGEIEDEYDEEPFAKDIVFFRNNVYIVEGSVRLEDLKEKTGIELESDEVDTIGGFVMEVLDRIPDKGEVLEYENIAFKILDIDKNRISKLRIQVNKNN